MRQSLKILKMLNLLVELQNVNLSTSDYKVEYVNDNTNAKAGFQKKDVEDLHCRYWKL